MRITSLLAIGLCLTLLGLRSTASDPARDQGLKPAPSPEADSALIDRRFRETVRPFLDIYCLGCHGKEKPKGDVDLSVFSTSEAVAKDLARWELVL